MSTTTAKTFLDYLLELLNSPLNQSHDRFINIGFYGREPLLNAPFIQKYGVRYGYGVTGMESGDLFDSGPG